MVLQEVCHSSLNHSLFIERSIRDTYRHGLQPRCAVCINRTTTGIGEIQFYQFSHINSCIRYMLNNKVMNPRAVSLFRSGARHYTSIGVRIPVLPGNGARKMLFYIPSTTKKDRFDEAGSTKCLGTGVKSHERVNSTGEEGRWLTRNVKPEQLNPDDGSMEVRSPHFIKT
jgi:hypothetical protein